jgi:NAD dependent epimerase/dehydratase family
MVAIYVIAFGDTTFGTSSNHQSNTITKAAVLTVTLMFTMIILGVTRTSAYSPMLQQRILQLRTTARRGALGSLRSSSTTVTDATTTTAASQQSNDKKGRLLVLGGTGYLGQEVCKKALEDGYSVVTLSRRGTPTSPLSVNKNSNNIDYRKGDARQKESIVKIIQEGDICGIVHCIGLLFDTASGLGSYNVYVSGSKSLPDNESTYDTITRQTAFHAIDAIMDFYKEQQQQQQQSSNNTSSSVAVTTTFPIPFCFTSAAEAGWPDVTGGKQIESIMPEFIKRYMIAKRAVENKLLTPTATSVIRPIIVRPSLIYSKDQLASIPAVASFTILNQIGLPFVDRPVTVDALATAIVKSISDTSVRGIQRYPQIDALSGTK